MLNVKRKGKENVQTELIIKKLSPDLLEDFLYFFEHVAHTDNPAWDRCYCLNYCSDANAAIPGFNGFDADQRRECAIRYVKEGILQGYLAYCKDKVVGWCNANDRASCHACFGWGLIHGASAPEEIRQKIKSVFCFTTAPEMRGKGIATALLARVIEDARTEGYAHLEAYPNKEHTDEYYNYVGPRGLYEKFGFVKHGETEWRDVMRKAL